VEVEKLGGWVAGWVAAHIGHGLPGSMSAPTYTRSITK
jgi:hypothetical protein